MKKFSSLRIPVKTTSSHRLLLCKNHLTQSLMRKSFVFLAMVLLLSCSKSKDETSEKNLKISPPTWIQGTWILEGSAGATTGFKFTTDDLCLIVLTNYSCNKEALKMYSNSSTSVNVKESSSDTEYSTDITILSTVSSYHFQKISATKMQWVNAVNNNAIYIKQ